MEKYDINPILNVSIQNTNFRFEGNTTFCDLVVKVNLKNFEKQFYQFTPTFIKNVIGEYLPIVKSVVNYGYSDLKPVVAKYYITPGGPARVLSFDKKYYKLMRGLDDSCLFEPGDLIPVKNMVKVHNECVQYDYCQTFTVTGKAVCLPEDVFNEETGRNIAYKKAMDKGYSRMLHLFNTLSNKTKKMFEEIDKQHNKLNCVLFK
jgi:hypothetical protein